MVLVALNNGKRNPSEDIYAGYLAFVQQENIQNSSSTGANSINNNNNLMAAATTEKSLEPQQDRGDQEGEETLFAHKNKKGSVQIDDSVSELVASATPVFNYWRLGERRKSAHFNAPLTADVIDENGQPLDFETNNDQTQEQSCRDSHFARVNNAIEQKEASRDFAHSTDAEDNKNEFCDAAMAQFNGCNFIHPMVLRSNPSISMDGYCLVDDEKNDSYHFELASAAFQEPLRNAFFQSESAGLRHKDKPNVMFINSTAESVASQVKKTTEAPKRKRMRTSPDQLRTLQKAFSQNPMPNAACRTALAKKLNMSTRSVQIWFQNRRAKVKLDQKRAFDMGIDYTEASDAEMSAYDICTFGEQDQQLTESIADDSNAPVYSDVRAEVRSTHEHFPEKKLQPFESDASISGSSSASDDNRHLCFLTKSSDCMHKQPFHSFKNNMYSFPEDHQLYFGEDSIYSEQGNPAFFNRDAALSYTYPTNEKDFLSCNSAGNESQFGNEEQLPSNIIGHSSPSSMLSRPPSRSASVFMNYDFNYLLSDISIPDPLSPVCLPDHLSNAPYVSPVCKENVLDISFGPSPIDTTQSSAADAVGEVEIMQPSNFFPSLGSQLNKKRSFSTSDIFKYFNNSSLENDRVVKDPFLTSGLATHMPKNSNGPGCFLSLETN